MVIEGASDMRKKGFTLIELLAVIVILAVIALIAVPIVLNIIENSKKGAIKSSALNYMKAVETYLVASKLDKNAVQLKKNTSYKCTENVIIGDVSYPAINDLVEINGYRPTGTKDTITINDKNEVIAGSLTINGYTVTISDKEIASVVKGPHIKVESISLNYTEQTMEKGSTFELKAIFAPKDASDQRVSYKSSDESIATVSENGIVTAKKNGTTKIIVTSKDDKDKKAECNITVITSATGVKITSSKTEVGLGKKLQLSGVIEPNDVTTNALTWTSSNPNVASVDENGLVTGISEGNVTITARTVNGKEATIDITSIFDCSDIINQEVNFDYTGSVQSFTSKCDGKYKLEVWGAQGGGSYPGYGGYSVGTYNIGKNQSVYVYVGGKGTTSAASSAGGNGYNGGGQGYNGGSGGGGMTHISKTSTDNPTSSWIKRSKEVINAISASQNFGSGSVTYYTSTTSTRNYKLVKSGTASASGTAYCYTSTYSPKDPYCKVCVGGTADENCTMNDDGNNDLAPGVNCFATRAVTKGQAVYCYVTALSTNASSQESSTATWNFKIGSHTTRTEYYASNTSSGNFDSNVENLIIVAGGGGGSTTNSGSRGGDGGGYQSGPVRISGTDNSTSYISNQTTGYGRGKGASASTESMAAGAGSGWWGGHITNSTAGGAGGGSGWIQNASLTDKHMTCYNCPTSSDANTKTQVTTSTGHAIKDYANTGNGYARITYLGK